jgi:hypothetical protein
MGYLNYISEANIGGNEFSFDVVLQKTTSVMGI